MARAKNTASKLQADGKDELNNIVAKANKAREKAREMLTAIHDGDVEDKDLNTAIKEAGSALKHLKTYLDKND